MADIASINTVEIANISKVSTVAIASVASIHGVGAVPPTEASSWASWDETSEAGLSSDDTFVILMENTSANGNETGVGGGLTGSDLVLTRAGTIAGATGSPPTREIAVNGSNYFTATTGLADGLFTGSTYTFICKINNLGSMGGEDHYFLIARDAGYSKIFGIGLENSPAGACTEAMSCYSGLNYTSSTPNTTGDVYFAIWYDGTYLRWGFTDSGSKPTKWSDFTSTDRGSWTGSCGYTSGDFTIIKFGARENTSAPLAPSYYYFVCSKSVLIDNDS